MLQRLHVVLVTGLIALPVAAQAQSYRERVSRAAASGLIVLERTDGPRPRVEADGLRIVRAVPVPHVMNGGGFGLSGHDYYEGATAVGRRGERRGPKEYVLAPAQRFAPVRP